MSDFVHEQYPGRLPTGELRSTPVRGLHESLMPRSWFGRILLGAVAAILVLFLLALLFMPAGIG